MILSKDEIIKLLLSEGKEKEELFERSAAVKRTNIGSITYMRGLIEYSNVCLKNCFYCGIRCANSSVSRYTLTDTEVLEAARFAYENRFGSVVLQGGENVSELHIATIEKLIQNIKKLSNGELGITLSLGEQTEKTYQRWFDAGAHRYLLRIESSNQNLFEKIHPTDSLHKYSNRLSCLTLLRKLGYQVGTGVMIGLPYQSIENLADDLLFMQDLDIDMCGMGPYIEHHQTPMYEQQNLLKSLEWRLDMAFKMVAVLRIIMPDINIAATTALQTIDPLGREKAIGIGANIVMPNITPSQRKLAYKLYEGKPFSEGISLPETELGYESWGDSPHFSTRNK